MAENISEKRVLLNQNNCTNLLNIRFWKIPWNWGEKKTKNIYVYLPCTENQKKEKRKKIVIVTSISTNQSNCKSNMLSTNVNCCVFRTVMTLGKKRKLGGGDMWVIFEQRGGFKIIHQRAEKRPQSYLTTSLHFRKKALLLRSNFHLEKKKASKRERLISTPLT